jgi:hypothetical protein
MLERIKFAQIRSGFKARCKTPKALKIFLAFDHPSWKTKIERSPFLVLADESDAQVILYTPPPAWIAKDKEDGSLIMPILPQDKVRDGDIIANLNKVAFFRKALTIKPLHTQHLSVNNITFCLETSHEMIAWEEAIKNPITFYEGETFVVHAMNKHSIDCHVYLLDFGISHSIHLEWPEDNGDATIVKGGRLRYPKEGSHKWIVPQNAIHPTEGGREVLRLFVTTSPCYFQSLQQKGFIDGNDVKRNVELEPVIPKGEFIVLDFPFILKVGYISR